MILLEFINLFSSKMYKFNQFLQSVSNFSNIFWYENFTEAKMDRHSKIHQKI